MDSELGKLSITREDQDELVCDGSDNTDYALNDYCLVGKFVTPRPDEVHNTCNCNGIYVHQVSL